jgi:acetyl esterase
VTKQLDSEAQTLLDVMRAIGAPALHTLSVEQARAQTRASLLTRGKPLALHHVEDVHLPSPHGALPLRLYRPTPGPLPIVLFIHGGGWTLNDIDTHDHLCRRIAMRSGWLVASLDYRRAPEHPHPAALEDARFAYDWLLANPAALGGDPAKGDPAKGDSAKGDPAKGDPAKGDSAKGDPAKGDPAKGNPALVAVAGESSGAATAAALAMLLRDTGAAPPALQILAYPMIDYPDRWPSYQERGSGYTLDSPLARWFVEHNLPVDFDPANPYRDPYLFPLGAPELGDLPPALVMTAEFDPLRDEGIAYAERLKAAGGVVEHLHVDNQMHGFLMIDRAVSRAGELIDHLADTLAATRTAGPSTASRDRRIPAE